MQRRISGGCKIAGEPPAIRKRESGCHGVFVCFHDEVPLQNMIATNARPAINSVLTVATKSRIVSLKVIMIVSSNWLAPLAYLGANIT
jgi:hypothetical protein